MSVGLAGCVVPDGSGPGDGSGSAQGAIAFYVKDAPADDFSGVFVTFSRVDVHRSGDEEASTSPVPTSTSSSSPVSTPVATTNTTAATNTTTPTANATTPTNTTSPTTNTTAPSNTTTPTNTTAPATNTTEPSPSSGTTNATSPVTANSTSSSPTVSPTLASSPSATDDEDDDEGDEGESGDAGWFTIVNSTHTVDLKAFQGDARAFLGDADVPAGRYTQIRIYVDEAYGIDNGTRVNLTVPSGRLKIVHPWTVGEGETTNLTVDFNLERSVIETGNGEFRLKPVMKLLIERPAEADESSDEAEAVEEDPEDRGPDGDHGKKDKPDNTRRPTRTPGPPSDHP